MLLLLVLVSLNGGREKAALVFWSADAEPSSSSDTPAASASSVPVKAEKHRTSFVFDDASVVVQSVSERGSVEARVDWKGTRFRRSKAWTRADEVERADALAWSQREQERWQRQAAHEAKATGRSSSAGRGDDSTTSSPSSYSSSSAEGEKGDHTGSPADDSTTNPNGPTTTGNKASPNTTVRSMLAARSDAIARRIQQVLPGMSPSAVSHIANRTASLDATQVKSSSSPRFDMEYRTQQWLLRQFLALGDYMKAAKLPSAMQEADADRSANPPAGGKGSRRTLSKDELEERATVLSSGYNKHVDTLHRYAAHRLRRAGSLCHSAQLDDMIVLSAAVRGDAHFGSAVSHRDSTDGGAEGGSDDDVSAMLYPPGVMKLDGDSMLASAGFTGAAARKSKRSGGKNTASASSYDSAAGGFVVELSHKHDERVTGVADLFEGGTFARMVGRLDLLCISYLALSSGELLVFLLTIFVIASLSSGLTSLIEWLVRWWNGRSKSERMAPRGGRGGAGRRLGGAADDDPPSSSSDSPSRLVNPLAARRTIKREILVFAMTKAMRLLFLVGFGVLVFKVPEGDAITEKFVLLTGLCRSTCTPQSVWFALRAFAAPHQSLIVAFFALAVGVAGFQF